MMQTYYCASSVSLLGCLDVGVLPGLGELPVVSNDMAVKHTGNWEIQWQVVQWL